MHLVAHSFGAWVAPSLALHRKPALLSLTLLEPTVFQLQVLAGANHFIIMTHAPELIRRIEQHIQTAPTP